MIGLHRDIDQVNCKGFCSILLQSQGLLIEGKGTRIYMIHSSIGNLPSLDMDFHKISNHFDRFLQGANHILQGKFD